MTVTMMGMKLSSKPRPVNGPLVHCHYRCKARVALSDGTLEERLAGHVRNHAHIHPLAPANATHAPTVAADSLPVSKLSRVFWKYVSNCASFGAIGS